MSNFEIKLKETGDKTFQLHVQKGSNEPKIYNLEGRTGGCKIKVTGNELESRNEILTHPTLITHFLLKKSKAKYIKEVRIDNEVVNLIGNDDFRELRLGDSAEFKFNAKKSWVSFHVERKAELDTVVCYLVVGCSK